MANPKGSSGPKDQACVNAVTDHLLTLQVSRIPRPQGLRFHYKFFQLRKRAKRDTVMLQRKHYLTLGVKRHFCKRLFLITWVSSKQL